MTYIVELDWWAYVLIAIGLFFVVLFINYVVKKMNEARLDDRLVRLQDKASVSTYSQAHRQPQEMPPRITRPLESIIEQSNPPTVNAQPPEKRDGIDKIQIMNFPDTKKVDVPHTSPENEIKLNPEPKPVFLGAIYDKYTNIKKSQSCTNADKNDAIDPTFPKSSESKSTPTVKELINAHNEEILKANDVTTKNSEQD